MTVGDEACAVAMRKTLRRYLAGQSVLFLVSIPLLVLTRRMGSREIAFFLESLGWLWGLNLVSVGLISLFSVRAQWTHRLVSTLALDFGSSLGSVFLVALTRMTHPQPRLFLFGFTLAGVLAIKAAILTRFAAANEARGSLNWHRAWIATVGTAILVASTGWTSKVSWPDGDGPTYLLMAKSLASDHDLDLRNNFARRDYLEFFPEPVGGSLFGIKLAQRERNTQIAIGAEHHTLKGVHGAELAWHDIGFPLALVPGYALGGRLGALLTLNVIAAAAGFAVFELALLLGGLAGAIYTWALFMFSAPMIAFGGELFAEMAGMAVATWAAVHAFRWDASRSKLSLLTVGILIGILPWLCVRYWVLGAGLALAVLIAAVRRSRAEVAASVLLIGAPVALSLALFALFDRSQFGTLLPNAGYFAIVSEQPQFYLRPDIGVSGLLFDGAYGLLPVAPFFVAAGALLGSREHRKRAALLLIPFAFSLLFMAFSRFWYGGWTPPARYLIAGLGLVAPACAIIFERSRTSWWLWGLGAWSWVVAICYVAVPLARFPSTVTSRRSGWMELTREAGIDFSGLFPTLLQPTAADFIKLTAFMALAALGVIASVRMPREDSRRRGGPLSGPERHSLRESS